MSNPLPPIEEMTLRQLRKIASVLNIPRYSRMRKEQLRDAIKQKKNDFPDLYLSEGELINKTSSLPSNSHSSPDNDEEKKNSFYPHEDAFNGGFPSYSDNVGRINYEGNQENIKNYVSESSSFSRDENGEIGNFASGDENVENLSYRGVWQDNLIRRYDVFDKRGTSTNDSNDIDGELRDSEIYPEGEEGEKDYSFMTRVDDLEDIDDIDKDLGELPESYGEDFVILLPRQPQLCYAYWDVSVATSVASEEEKQKSLVLRLYDVTDIDLDRQKPNNIQEYPCMQVRGYWYIPIPVSDHDYVLEVGYRDSRGNWTKIVRSHSVKVPALFPSDWIEDLFITVPWKKDLTTHTLDNLVLIPPKSRSLEGLSLFNPLDHVAGSLSLDTFSSHSTSSWGHFSSADIIPRQFWLIADAELVVYGATEADATVTIGGHKITLNPDGTFCFRMAFSDGTIDYPISAIASDGEQNRSIHMTFNRQTLVDNTNTKDNAILEWFPPTDRS